MKVLLICDDYWHPGQVPIGGVSPLKECGFQFDIITNANDFSPDLPGKYPAVLLSKCDEVSQTDKQPWKTSAVQRAFTDYVENGGGLLAVHSAVVCGNDTHALDSLIGCRFIGHPNACPVSVQPIKLHPVTEDVGFFCETDEHYRIEITAEDANILLASYSPPQGEESKYQEDPYHNTTACICPAGYIRTQGKGRICVLTPGHNPAVWQNAQFQKLLENALNWCAKKTPFNN
ncbi:MAG: ThuA domain-containing protein [Treponema sp.]|jgi:type 1 glutamine amidotransferase|nr:ThuA domain-containing protein [Treponema sp.]